jgi:hypothetical protein
MAKGHNNPPVILELTREEAEFVLKNADTNMAQGLAILTGGFSVEAQRKTVDLIEQFRPIRDKVKEALK